MAFWHIKTPVSFVSLFELSQSKNKSMACSLINLVDALPLIVAGLYFKFVSKNVTILLIITSTLHLIAIIVIALVMPESPKWLLVTGQRDKAIEVFNYIAKFNGSKFRFSENSRFIESDLNNQNNVTLNTANDKSYAQVLKDVSMQMF